MNMGADKFTTEQWEKARLALEMAMPALKMVAHDIQPEMLKDLADEIKSEIHHAESAMPVMLHFQSINHFSKAKESRKAQAELYEALGDVFAAMRKLISMGEDVRFNWPESKPQTTES